MKTNLTRTLIMGAVALAGTAVAFADDNVSAQIPFAFQAGGVKFYAGAYSISQYGHNDAGVLTLQNRLGRDTKFVNTMSHAPEASPASDSKYPRAKLVFRCREASGCALSAVQMENGRTWTLRIPRRNAIEAERIAVIYLDKNHAD
jgi:hypothetical protein